MLFIVSAPSGTGKSSLIKSLLDSDLKYNNQISISYTTRRIRPGEYEGVHYYFISTQKFLKMIREKEFLEHAKVFNHYYGTSKKLVDRSLSNGINVFLDIDWQGAQQLRSKNFNICSIFVLPPSKLELYRRLSNRGQDTHEVISKRMKAAVSEMKHYLEYDYLIINDNFGVAVSDLSLIVRSQQLSTCMQKYKYHSLIDQLITNVVYNKNIR